MSVTTPITAPRVPAGPVDDLDGLRDLPAGVPLAEGIVASGNTSWAFPGLPCLSVLLHGASSFEPERPMSARARRDRRHPALVDQGSTLEARPPVAGKHAAHDPPGQLTDALAMGLLALLVIGARENHPCRS